MPRKRTVQHAEVPSDDGTLPTLDADANDATIETTLDETPHKSGAKRLADKLKSALFGDGDSSDDEPPAKRRSIGKQRQADMAALIGAGGGLALCWIVNQRIKDPAYAPVAPSMQEAQMMIEPYGRILARRMKMAGKLSEDALDIAASMNAILYYAIRASEMQTRIKQEIEGQGNGQGQTYNPAAIGYSGVTVAPTRTPHSGGRRLRRVQRQGDADAGTSNLAAHSNGITESERRETDLMAELLRADADGRAERGLL